ncbi:MAG: sodium:solute symporter family protein [Bacillota bacterium]
MNPIVLGIVILYLGAMLYIGWYASKRIKTNEDFLVAGRRLGPLMLAGTLAATEVGGGSTLGVVEKAYGAWGLSASWYVLTMAITFLVLAFIAPKLRGAMVKTIPEYFRRRYGEAPGFITAVVMILPLVGLTAGQIIASSVVLSVMTGLTYQAAVIIVSVVVTVYSVMGGLWGVTYTDVIQWVLIVVGMAITIPFALNAAGGWSTVASMLPPEKLSFTQGIGWKTIIALIVMYTASFAVGQEAVQRFYAAKDEKTAMQASFLTAGVYVIFAFIPAVLGLIAFAMVQEGIIDSTQIMAHGARYALPTLAIQTMPPLLVGLLFSALISATMSSADSNMLGAAGIFGNDIYKRYINRSADEGQVLSVIKGSMILVGVLSMLIAYFNKGSIINLLMFSFTLRAGGSSIPYVVGHYWKKASWAGAMASLIVGSTMVLLVEKKYLSFFGLDPIIPGLISSLVVFVLFTSLYPNREDTTQLTAE